MRFSPPRLWRNQPAGLGLRNQVGYPEIKAEGPARGGISSSRVLPRAGAGALRSCRCEGRAAGAESRVPQGWRAWALSWSRQGCAQVRQQHIWSGVHALRPPAQQLVPRRAVLGPKRVVGSGATNQLPHPCPSVSRCYSRQKHLPRGSGRDSPRQECAVLSVCGQSRSRAAPERGGRMRGSPGRCSLSASISPLTPSCLSPSPTEPGVSSLDRSRSRRLSLPLPPSRGSGQ